MNVQAAKKNYNTLSKRTERKRLSKKYAEKEKQNEKNLTGFISVLSLNCHSRLCGC